MNSAASPLESGANLVHNCAPSWLQILWLTKLLCVIKDWCANIKYQNAELNNPTYEYQQDRQCTYNVTLRRIHITIVAVQNQ
jgi:hypothetical protein